MLHTEIGKQLSGLSQAAKLATMIGGDAIFLPICFLAATALRLGSLDSALNTALTVQLGLGLLTLPVLGYAGLYRTVVRYIDIRVVVRSCLALAAVVLLMYLLALALDINVIPRAALLIYWFVAFTYVITSRFIARALLRQGLRRAGRPRLRTAIYGAGDAGAQLAQTMQFSLEYKAVCFLDDRTDLHRKTVAGLTVYPPDALQDAIYQHDVDQIVVAIPSATAAQKRRLIETLDPAGLPVKILPGLVELVDGYASVSDIRDLDVADLLGRDPVMPCVGGRGVAHVHAGFGVRHQHHPARCAADLLVCCLHLCHHIPFHRARAASPGLAPRRPPAPAHRHLRRR